VLKSDIVCFSCGAAAELIAEQVETGTQQQCSYKFPSFNYKQTKKIHLVTMSGSTPKRIGQIIRLKRDCLQAYKDCHASAWPAVLQQIKDCNISDYSIYLDEESTTLFATMKYNGTEFEVDMEKMRANPEVQRWWQVGCH
jgi:L-rhamnose mutarotase